MSDRLDMIKSKMDDIGEGITELGDMIDSWYEETREPEPEEGPIEIEIERDYSLLEEYLQEEKHIGPKRAQGIIDAVKELDYSSPLEALEEEPEYFREKISGFGDRLYERSLNAARKFEE